SNMSTSLPSQLKKKCEISEDLKDASIKSWLSSVGKLLDQAKLATEKSDLETVYISNVKVSSILLEIIPNHKEYGKIRSEATDSYIRMPVPHPTPEPTSNAFLNSTNSLQQSSPSCLINNNIDGVSSTLTSSDSNSLNIVHMQNGTPKSNNAPKQTIYPQTPPVSAPSFETPTLKQYANSLPNKKKLLDVLPDSNKIEVSVLRDLLDSTEDPSRILVLDVRHRAAFDSGHIKTKNIVCLDPIILTDEISSINLESKLVVGPEFERKLFADRHNFDLVVYHDHDS
ncbi:5035_t:CDS:2, partial [Cetraspora pellucida]